jgi:hypothetical protein
MTTPSPEQTAGLAPTAQAQAQQAQATVAAANTAPQTLAGNVGAFTTTSTGGNIYFGTTQSQPQGVGPGSQSQLPGFQQTGVNALLGGKTTTYGIYDPGATFTLPGATAGTTAGAPVMVNITAATNMYYQWTQAQQNEFRAQYALVDSNAYTATDQALATDWAGLVNQAAAYAQAGQAVTPWDVLAKDISSNSGGIGKDNKEVTKNVSNVTLTSQQDANAIFVSAAQSLLGRAPTADEEAAFHANLNQVETANPTISTVEKEYNPEGFVVSQDTLKSTGGVGTTAAENLAEQNIRGTSEYANYQAATTYMGALQQLLSGGQV